MNWLESIFLGLKKLLTWWVIVAPWEQAVRVRLGKRVTLLSAGVHWRLPVIDKFYIQSVRLRTADLPMLTVTTKDGYPVSVAGNLFFEIVDMLKLYETLHHAQEVMVDIASSAITKTIHGLNKEECTTQAIEESASALLDLGQYGINSSAIHLTDFAFVKTYRLIQDTKQKGWDNLLNTVEEVRNG